MQERQFKELFLSEYDRMYKAACILLGDEDEAKDVVQDVFAKLWDGTNPLREESQRTFLLTCVRNRCLNIIAQRQTHQEAMRLFAPTAVESGKYDEEIIEAVSRYVEERLTPQTSRIIRMHFDEEQSYKEISNSLGISLSAVNKHIQHTDEQFDQMLDEVNVPMPDANKEWERFRRSHLERRSKGWMQVAASIVGVLMLSGIAYATINHFIMEDEKPNTAVTERKPDVRKVRDAHGVAMVPTKKAPVIFNNVELQQIMQYVADGYGVKVEFKNKAARTIRFYLQWEADDTLQEIIDKINHFEKVHLTLNEETITID